MIYDASFAYEVAVIMQDAITRILGPDPEDRFWYLTLYNETYPMPALPEGRRARPSAGASSTASTATRPDPTSTGTTCGPRCASRGRCGAWPRRPRSMLAERWGVSADTWAVTSWSRLRTDALEVERWNRLHPGEEPRRPLVTEALGAGPDPVVAITDYMRAVPDQVARFIDRPYTSLGTDGFGRSDARGALRELFRGRCGAPGGGRPERARPAGSWPPWSRKPSPISASTLSGRALHRP